MLYPQFAKFGGYKYCSSKDMFLFCPVIKQEHIIKGSGDYNCRGKSPFHLVWSP